MSITPSNEIAGASVGWPYEFSETARVFLSFRPGLIQFCSLAP